MSRRWAQAPPTLAAALVATLCACGPGGSLYEPEYLPLAVGNRWVYVRSDDHDERHTEEITEEPVLLNEPGLLMVRSRNDRLVKRYSKWVARRGRIGETVSQDWERETLIGSATYGPELLQFSRSFARLGYSTSEAHLQRETDGAGRQTRQRRKQYSWIVESTTDEISVPAGTFTCARILRIDESDGEEQRSWYAPGVGKVREQDPNDDLLLLEYEVVSP